MVEHRPAKERISATQLAAITNHEIKARLQTAHGGWHAVIPALLKQIDGGDGEEAAPCTPPAIGNRSNVISTGSNRIVTPSLLRLQLFDMPRLKSWHSGRVLLLGDAAHAMSPTTLQGASIALEDAMYLTSVLRTADGHARGSSVDLTDPEAVRAAFERFQAHRLPRVYGILAEGRRRSSILQRKWGSWAAWARDQLLRIVLWWIGDNVGAADYQYKIEWQVEESGSGKSRL